MTDTITGNYSSQIISGVFGFLFRGTTGISVTNTIEVAVLDTAGNTIGTNGATLSGIGGNGSSFNYSINIGTRTGTFQVVGRINSIVAASMFVSTPAPNPVVNTVLSQVHADSNTISMLASYTATNANGQSAVYRLVILDSTLSNILFTGVIPFTVQASAQVTISIPSVGTQSNGIQYSITGGTITIQLTPILAGTSTVIGSQQQATTTVQNTNPPAQPVLSTPIVSGSTVSINYTSSGTSILITRNGTVISNSLTQVSGTLTDSGLAPGTYQYSFVAQANNLSSTPATTSVTIAQIVQNVSFQKKYPDGFISPTTNILSVADFNSLKAWLATNAPGVTIVNQQNTTLEPTILLATLEDNILTVLASHQLQAWVGPTDVTISLSSATLSNTGQITGVFSITDNNINSKDLNATVNLKTTSIDGTKNYNSATTSVIPFGTSGLPFAFDANLPAGITQCRLSIFLSSGTQTISNIISTNLQKGVPVSNTKNWIDIGQNIFWGVLGLSLLSGGGFKKGKKR